MDETKSSTNDSALLVSIERHLAELLQSGGPPPARWLRIPAAAAYSGVSVRTIKNLLAGGKLRPHRPVKGRVLIDKNQLDALMIGSTQTVRVGRGLTRRAGT